MAHNHPLSTPFATNPIDGDGLDDALVERVALTFDDVAEIQALDLTGKATSHIVFGTSVYEYDASDTVSAHNGTTILVTTDGKRFKNTGTRVNGRATYDVDDRDLTTPPGSPSEGDSYLLPASPSGAWASYGKHIAVYINGAWVYIAPQRGMLCYLDDETAYVHYDGSAWQDGLGSLQITDGTIKARSLEQAYGWCVEEETSTPPSIPSAGVLYIVGTSATGAWSGEDGNIARSTGSAWEFVESAEGMSVYNKDTSVNLTYRSGSWTPTVTPPVILSRSAIIKNEAGATITTSATGTQIISLGAKSISESGNRFDVHFHANITRVANQGVAVNFGLFINSETSNRDSALYSFGTLSYINEFQSVSGTLSFSPANTSSNNYYLKAWASSGSTVISQALSYIEEVSG